MNILIIEDDPHIAQFTKQVLVAQNHYVTIASDGLLGFEKARKHKYDAIILDILLPNMDGITLCRDLRRSKVITPIIIVSSQYDEESRVKGLDAGADDYLVKPFNYKELLARLRAITRRPSVMLQSRLLLGDLEIDPDSRRVQRGSRTIHLRPKEYELLAFMMRNPNIALARHVLLSAIWQTTIESSSNRLEVCVKHLRAKIDAPKETPMLHTVRGVGYRLSAE